MIKEKNVKRRKDEEELEIGLARARAAIRKAAASDGNLSSSIITNDVVINGSVDLVYRNARAFYQ